MCVRNTAAQEQDDDLHRAQKKKATRRKRKERCEPKKTRQTRGLLMKTFFFKINVLLHFKTAFNQQNKNVCKVKCAERRKPEQQRE